MRRQARQFLELQAEVLQAVGHPFRLAIVEVLADGELCVCEIAKRVGGKRSNLSRHLSVMSAAGVLSVRKEGVRMMYSLAVPCITEFLACIRQVVRSRIEKEVAALPGRSL